MQFGYIISQLSGIFVPAVVAVRTLAALGVGYHARSRDQSGIVSGGIVLVTGTIGAAAYAIAAVFGDRTTEDGSHGGQRRESIGRLECPDCGRENVARSKFCAGCTSELDRSSGPRRLFSRFGDS